MEQFYKTLASEAYHMTPASQALVLASALRCCQHFTWLARDSCERGLMYYNLTPKLHFFIHVAEQCALSNAAYSWTYADEDYMGRITKLARACAAGAGPFRLNRALAHKCLKVVVLRARRAATAT